VASLKAVALGYAGAAIGHDFGGNYGVLAPVALIGSVLVTTWTVAVTAPLGANSRA
jgi:hypothetical protein